MSVGLLTITHNGIGQQLLGTATDMLGSCPLNARSLEVHLASDPERILQEAQQAAHDLDQGDGVLILTDMYGSTPSNIANRIEGRNLAVVSGINLPMLIRVLNYPRLSLSELEAKALSGGRDGVLSCRPEGPQVP